MPTHMMLKVKATGSTYRIHGRAVMGQWVMGQMGQQIWKDHMGHGSVSVSH